MIQPELPNKWNFLFHRIKKQFCLLVLKVIYSYLQMILPPFQYDKYNIICKKGK